MAQALATRSIHSSLASLSSGSLHSRVEKIRTSDLASKTSARKPRKSHKLFRVTATRSASEVVPVSPEDLQKTEEQMQLLRGIMQPGDTPASMWSKPTVRRKTKIVCTIGPSTNTREMIWKLAEEGMNVARLNMSHGDHSSHQKVIDLVKEYNAQSKDNVIAIMLDTKGPEVRSGDLPQPIALENGKFIPKMLKLKIKGGDWGLTKFRGAGMGTPTSGPAPPRCHPYSSSELKTKTGLVATSLIDLELLKLASYSSCSMENSHGLGVYPVANSSVTKSSRTERVEQDLQALGFEEGAKQNGEPRSSAWVPEEMAPVAVARDRVQGSWNKMENMQCAEEFVKEFLVFRGFTSTLQAFERELGSDIGKEFQGLLEENEAQLCRARSNASSALEASMGRTNSIANSSTSILSSGVLDDARDRVVTGTAEVSRELASSKITERASSKVENPVEESGRTNDALQMSQDCFSVGDIPGTYKSYQSVPFFCVWSGNNIASASVDGTVRIWIYDSSTPASRNATIYCGAEIMSLEWDCKSDRLVWNSASYEQQCILFMLEDDVDC
ncbi:plastidic pyruvate kinase beta subunit 1 [Actinidia rufa]|uniref:Plastidic pyruvate kinase beta subunit 1 n=1 Tax=Actinidia rufa TaxID=165716 RepID=A0A7J0G6K6_9ERIC|nr:plastidic pyruvate kinase beta subunit 1 [Actinidia rufa]